MKKELPKPVIIGAISVLAIVLVVLGLAFFRGSSGDISNQVVVPKPWGGPPGGFHKPGSGAPMGAPAAPPKGANDNPSG